jgi:hypothetical protein
MMDIRNFQCIGLRPAYVINLYKHFKHTSVALPGTTEHFFRLDQIK